jgi:hypothetical protein
LTNVVETGLENITSSTFDSSIDDSAQNLETDRLVSILKSGKNHPLFFAQKDQKTYSYQKSSAIRQNESGTFVLYLRCACREKGRINCNGTALAYFKNKDIVIEKSNAGKVKYELNLKSSLVFSIKEYEFRFKNNHECSGFSQKSNPIYLS